MITPGLERGRVVLSAERDPGGTLEALRSVGESPAWRVLKHDERSSVFSGEVLMNQAVIVKCHHVRSVGDLAARATGRTKLVRQARGARRLAMAGFLCAEPRLLVRGRDARGRLVETLVMDRLPGGTVMDGLRGAGSAAVPIDVLAREIGLLTRRLEQEGLFNRDHKPSNMVVLPPPFRPPVALIDTVGVQRRRPRAGLERMLANVVFELVGTGRLPARSVLARGLIASMGSRDRRRFRVLWRGIEHRVARHDDLEPRDPVER